MSLDAFPVRAAAPEVVEYQIRLVGATTDVTAQAAAGGITAAYSTTGTYTLTFDDNPGTFLNWAFAFGAATPAGLAGFTAVRDTWDSTNLVFTFVVYNSSFAAADLAAAQYIDITLRFQRGAV